jgi:hypothetical protein
VPFPVTLGSIFGWGLYVAGGVAAHIHHRRRRPEVQASKPQSKLTAILLTTLFLAPTYWYLQLSLERTHWTDLRAAVCVAAFAGLLLVGSLASHVEAKDLRALRRDLVLGDLDLNAATTEFRRLCVGEAIGDYLAGELRELDDSANAVEAAGKDLSPLTRDQWRKATKDFFKAHARLESLLTKFEQAGDADATAIRQQVEKTWSRVEEVIWNLVPAPSIEK